MVWSKVTYKNQARFLLFVCITFVYPLGIVLNSDSLLLVGHHMSVPPIPLVFYQDEISADIKIVAYGGDQMEEKKLDSAYLANMEGPGYRVAQYLIPLFIELDPDHWHELYKNSICKNKKLQTLVELKHSPDFIDIQVSYRSPYLKDKKKNFWVNCHG